MNCDYLTFSKKILIWHHGIAIRNLPWQLNKTIYKIWLSEIMLQQTQVVTVIPYYIKFIKKFPTITQLSKSGLDVILYMWSGLGYYRRAINLYKTANIIVKYYNGKFPHDFNTLISFPGIGQSTAGAILSLALNKPYPILDSNIKRILIRYYNLDYDKVCKRSEINKKLWFLIEQLLPCKNSAIFNQAMMDLGQLVCTYVRPVCYVCPINDGCQFFLLNKNKKNNHVIKKSLSKRELSKTIWWVILLHKTYEMIWLEKRVKEKIWRELFCFPEFNDLNILNEWLLKNNLYEDPIYNMNTIRHKVSNISLTIYPVLINVYKKINYNKVFGIWYDLNKTVYVGLPKPVFAVIKILKNNYLYIVGNK